MAATLHHGDASDWGNGFASFNLMDFEHGLVRDGLANGARTGVPFERLNIPGLIPFEQSFTAIADGPASRPGQAHAYRFEVDPVARRIVGSIDGGRRWSGATSRSASTPSRSASLITLQPIRDGRSTSLRGQGTTGRLGAIRVRPLH